MADIEYVDAADAVAYLRTNDNAGVCYESEHGWWVTAAINDERHPEVFRLHLQEGEKLREHAALQRLDPNPHPGREVWILRRMP